MIRVLIHNGFTKAIKLCFRRLLGKEGTFVSLKAYARKHPQMVTYLSQEKETTVYAENQIDFNYENALQIGEEIDTSVVLIKGASCFAYSDIILLNDRYYYSEIKDNPIIGRASNCADGYVLKTDKKYYYELEIPSKMQRLQEGIFLSGLFSWNYYHFTYQIVSKLQWIEVIAPDVPLLVDRKATEITSFSSLLGICNTQHRPIVVLEENVKYIVEKLYLVSTTTVLLPNYKVGIAPPAVECLYRPSTLRYLRKKIIPFGKYSPNYPKRIFLGRKYVTSGRRPFNEEECIACAKDYGFKVVYPELMSFEQQVGLFNHADCIIGGSGAAFTNLIYCNNNVKVMVFSKYHVNIALWQTIIDFVGGKLCYLEENEGQIQPPQMLHAAYHIDVQKLKEKLHEIA